MSCAAKTPNIEHTRNNSLFAKFEFPPPWQTTRQVFHHLVFSIDQSRGTSHLHSGEGRNIRLSAKWTRMGTSRARQPFGSQVVHYTVRFYHREWERKSCGLTMGAGRKSGISQNGPEGRETRSPTIWIPDGRFHRQHLPLGMGAEELRADDGGRGEYQAFCKMDQEGRETRSPTIWTPDGPFHHQNLLLGVGTEELRADYGSKAEYQAFCKMDQDGRETRSPTFEIPDGPFHHQSLPLGMGEEELRADDRVCIQRT